MVTAGVCIAAAWLRESAYQANDVVTRYLQHQEDQQRDNSGVHSWGVRGVRVLELGDHLVSLTDSLLSHPRSAVRSMSYAGTASLSLRRREPP